MTPASTVVLPRRANADATAFEACPKEEADVFSIYIEDSDGALHVPEDFGIYGQFDFDNFRDASIVATWISAGAPASTQLI